MGWTLTGVAFTRLGAPTQTHAIGNNLAWNCPDCAHPVLFVYRGAGGKLANPAICPGCGQQYYLTPPYGAVVEPPAGIITQPAAIMQIV